MGAGRTAVVIQSRGTLRWRHRLFRFANRQLARISALAAIWPLFWALIGAAVGFIVGIAIHLPWLKPLPEDFSKLLTTIATILGSLGITFSLWWTQRKTRSANVEAVFKEIFKDLNQALSSLDSAISREKFYSEYIAWGGLDRFLRGRIRTTRGSVETGDPVPLSDDEMVLQAMMQTARPRARAVLDASTKALGDYEDFKSTIPDLLPKRMAQLVHLQRLILRSKPSLEWLSEADLADPVRWEQAIERQYVEVLIEQVADWINGSSRLSS
jgi:hypothetical protein